MKHSDHLLHSVSLKLKKMALSFRFGEECVWVDESIKILDNFQIDPPYDKVTLDSENVTASTQLGYDRVVKMVSVSNVS